MQPALLARELEDFLAGAPGAMVIEDGETLFDLSAARYSISGDDGKCLLHLWSAERNAVRRVIEVERKRGEIRLVVQRFGRSKPTSLEIVADRDRRAPSLQRRARLQYQRLLGRLLERNFPDWKLAAITSTADLEHSFSPVYARGLLRHGRSAIAFLGVNSSELQASIDAALTFALLWLHYSRERESPRSFVEGLRVFVPRGCADVVRARMHYLNRASLKFELFEVDEREESIAALDISDQGNIATRLVRCPDAARVHDRFGAAAQRVRGAVPECEAVVLSSTELAFRLHGLEFARARISSGAGSFAREQEIVFGSGAHETLLNADSEPLFDDLMSRLREIRRPGGDKRQALWRMHPERWLETEVKRDVTALDAQLDPSCVYAQVPAFAASDRGMIDLLARTREGRLAVIELKADEDIHLPLQGVDYWSRVKWHQEREEFHGFGYFVSRDGTPQPLSTEAPLLFLVAPALHIHPATDIVLRYLSPEVNWTLIALDERWREEVKVVFRKRRSQAASQF